MDQGVWKILVDTACAKTVAGEAWLSAAVAYLWERYGYVVDIVPDDEPFRFGPGPVIRSTKAALIPMEWQELALCLG